MVHLPVWKEWPEGLARPHELRGIYSRGYQGAYRSDEASEDLADSFSHPTFRDVADDFNLWDYQENREASGGLYLPYLSTLSLCPSAYSTAQQTGDCVSFWARNHSDSVRANDILTRGESESWRALGCTEAIYGWRESHRPGMSCATAVSFLTREGGMLLRKEYPEADLSSYNVDLAIRWGRRFLEVPHGILEYAQQHQIKVATLVTDIESLAAAYRCGYSVGGCSGLGISARRDEHGVSEPSGSWAHAMWVGGYDERDETLDEYGEPLALFINSWGAWNRGPSTILGTGIGIPPGSCWVRSSVVERRCLKGGGFYTMSSAEGWPAIQLPNLGATGEI